MYIFQVAPAVLWFFSSCVFCLGRWRWMTPGGVACLLKRLCYAILLLWVTSLLCTSPQTWLYNTAWNLFAYVCLDLTQWFQKCIWKYKYLGLVFSAPTGLGEVGCIRIDLFTFPPDIWMRLCDTKQCDKGRCLYQGIKRGREREREV